MIIENPDQFKAWLTSVLEPLCDADPAALAKYVYALVKKDKTLEELRVGMVEQLDVFLQSETKNFVELLFKTLETQQYILPPSRDDLEGGRTPPGVVPQPQLPPTTNEQNLALPLTTPNDAPLPSVPVNGAALSVIKREPRKSDSETEDKDREKRPRSRGRARSRTRSRSRSWDRDRRRSRSREHIRRDRERDRSRPWRNKSPPNARRHNRRRTRSRSLSPLRRIRDGPELRTEHRSRFRNRSPTPTRSRTRSRSRSRTRSKTRSRSIERKKLDRLVDRSDMIRQDRLDSPTGPPNLDSNHGDVDMRLSATNQSMQSVVVGPLPVPNNQVGGFPPKRRCRDFDEKGYCMRGDLCPYDHGTDPVVLEEVALSRVLTFGAHGAQAPPNLPPVPSIPEPPPGPNGNAPPPHLPLASLPPPHLRNQHHSNMEYNPDAPSMEPRMAWGRHPVPPGPGMYGRGQRELISVPVTQHTNPPEMTQMPSNPLKRKQAFDFNRLGPKQRAVQNSSNCSLELKKVPRVLNTITQLNNHFSKFGKIVNIQVSFGGDPEAALITFQTPMEAKTAYRSTQAVLNNRFIKVFWHNNLNNNALTGSIENVPPGTRPSVKERLGATATVPNAKPEENEYVPTRRSTEEPPPQPLVPVSPKVPPAATREDKVQGIKKAQEMLAVKETLKKKQEEKRKEALKLTADLRKRKQELLDKQLAEMKLLIEKVQKNPDQKDAIMDAIKAMQLSIDGLRKDLAANGQTGAKTAPKSREQTQKEILDAELDLMTAQQEGQDSSELQKRLNELRAHAMAIGLNSTSSAGRGSRITRSLRGSHSVTFRGRGRGSFAHVSVDHRPTSLLVSGYETEEKADVLAHFKQFGEIVNQIVDDATPSIVMNFKSRKEAEVALAKGRNFQDRLLSVTWVSGHHLHRGHGNAISSSNANPATASLSVRPEQLQSVTDDDLELEVSLCDVQDEDIDLESAEALLLDENEEEEDEDGEPRSWRR